MFQSRDLRLLLLAVLLFAGCKEAPLRPLDAEALLPLPADLAWEAGKSLPANHPLLAQLYTTAGYWLASSDPAAADRFYQAIVRRCAETPAGKAAEEKRWFSWDLGTLESMPSLPPEFARNPERELSW